MGKHTEKRKSKKHKKEKRESKKRKLSSSSASSSEEVWIEKTNLPSKEPAEDKSVLQREEWLSLPSKFTSVSNVCRRREREENERLAKEQSRYNPSQNVRELNPYWKDGGEGLPTSSGQFKKPTDHSDSHYGKEYKSNWRKKSAPNEVEGNKTLEVEPVKQLTVEKTHTDHTLTDEELNALAAKAVKAEIMGNTTLALQLKEKLEKVRAARVNHEEDERVILTSTNSKGQSRPLKMECDYGKNSDSRRKKEKVETHRDGQRIRYFADDDKYSLKQMFEEEKYSSVEDQNRQFVRMAGMVRKNDDMDDIFTDDIRKRESDVNVDKKSRTKAITEHHAVARSLDSCSRCLQSEKMRKHLMISMGESVYLCLPHFEPLTEGHCLLVPVRHVPSTTQLDENELSELVNFRKALCQMFAAQNKCVVFFETVLSLHRFPHMIVECVPLLKQQGDSAPIYFKKAIDESETEWASNKKLVRLVGQDIRRTVPKCLPYFCVMFGTDEGFAHVIEDERHFPRNFAQEIIGGMLDLHHSKWRKPKAQGFDEQSKHVLSFSNMWSPFDCTAGN